jgi:Family of unknown function (DUF6526)
MAEQNFANHTKFFPLFHFFVLPVLLVNLGVQVYWLKEFWNTFRGIFNVLLALAFILGFLSARRFALSVQDIASFGSKSACGASACSPPICSHASRSSLSPNLFRCASPATQSSPRWPEKYSTRRCKSAKPSSS